MDPELLPSGARQHPAVPGNGFFVPRDPNPKLSRVLHPLYHNLGAGKDTSQESHLPRLVSWAVLSSSLLAQQLIELGNLLGEPGDALISPLNDVSVQLLQTGQQELLLLLQEAPELLALGHDLLPLHFCLLLQNPEGKQTHVRPTSPRPRGGSGKIPPRGTHQQVFALPLPLSLGFFASFPQGAQMLLWHLLEGERGDLLGILPIWDQEERDGGGFPPALLLKLDQISSNRVLLKLENTMNPN